MTLKIFTKREPARGFQFRVFINAKTGRVNRITAGCRTWKSFHEAFEQPSYLRSLWESSNADWFRANADSARYTLKILKAKVAKWRKEQLKRPAKAKRRRHK